MAIDDGERARVQELFFIEKGYRHTRFTCIDWN